MAALDRERAIGALHQPCPSAAEMADRGLSEFFLEALEVAAGFFYRVGYPSARLTTPLRPQAIPIEAMVEMLGSIIEGRALTCFLDDFFETLRLEFAAFDQIVEI